VNENQKLPSDALKSRPKPLRAVLIGLAAVVVIAAGGTGAYAFNQAQTATSTPTPTMTPYVATLTQDELDSVESGAEQQQTIIAADEKAAADAQAAADAAAAQQAAEQPTSSKHPAGTPLPFIPSSDPQNANGGDYTDPSGYCESGSASTVNGVPTCD
jgi:uncharacterized protein HemX